MGAHAGMRLQHTLHGVHGCMSYTMHGIRANIVEGVCDELGHMFLRLLRGEQLSEGEKYTNNVS